MSVAISDNETITHFRSSAGFDRLNDFPSVIIRQNASNSAPVSDAETLRLGRIRAPHRWHVPPAISTLRQGFPRSLASAFTASNTDSDGM